MAFVATLMYGRHTCGGETVTRRRVTPPGSQDLASVVCSRQTSRRAFGWGKNTTHWIRLPLRGGRGGPTALHAAAEATDGVALQAPALGVVVDRRLQEVVRRRGAGPSVGRRPPHTRSLSNNGRACNGVGGGGWGWNRTLGGGVSG